MRDLILQPGRFNALSGPLVTVVMDGVGLSDYQEDNALKLARTPTLDYLFNTFNTLPLRAHGSAVGLPSEGDMGNSEVGHMNLGAGRIVYQDLAKINKVVAEGTFHEQALHLGAYSGDEVHHRKILQSSR